MTKKVNKLKNSLIDLDLIRGSAFNKTKPKQSWLTTSYYGIIRVIFLPFYLNWWIDQTNRKICCILLGLYLLQLCSMFIYLNNDQSDKNVDDIPPSEVITPLFMFFFLGILYSQIFVSSGNHRKSYLKSTQINNVSLKEKFERPDEQSVNEEQTSSTLDLKDQKSDAKQQVKKVNPKYIAATKLNKGRLKFKTCPAIRTRSTSRSSKCDSSKRKRHLTTNDPLTTIQQSKQEPIIENDTHNEIKPTRQPTEPTNVSSNGSSTNLSQNATINTLKQELKCLKQDEDDSTSGEDCSPYSSISSNTHLSKLLLMGEKGDLNDDENTKSKLNDSTSGDVQTPFEPHVYQPKKTKYFYFQEYKEVAAVKDGDVESTKFDYNDPEDENDFKRKTNLNISDSESGSVSPTTPMKSLNDWPMINSDNSTEDEDEEVLINVDEKVEQELISKHQVETPDNSVLSGTEHRKRLNSLTNKSLNLYQDENEMKTDSVDKISCTIYQQDGWQKINLSMIDISSLIIKKVDTVRYTNEYFYFAILFSLLFAFIPQIFRFQAICMNLNNTDFLQSSTASLTNLVTDKQLMSCDQHDLSILGAYGLKKNDSECRILKTPGDKSPSTKVNKSAFVCGAINGSNSSEEFIEYLNYLPVLIFDLLIDVFKNSIYSLPMKFIVFVALIERLSLSLLFFILLCVAERTYREVM